MADSPDFVPVLERCHSLSRQCHLPSPTVWCDSKNSGSCVARSATNEVARRGTWRCWRLTRLTCGPSGSVASHEPCDLTSIIRAISHNNGNLSSCQDVPMSRYMTCMAATDPAAAIRTYSREVTPFSSLTNLSSLAIIPGSAGFLADMAVQLIIKTLTADQSISTIQNENVRNLHRIYCIRLRLL